MWLALRVLSGHCLAGACTWPVPRSVLDFFRSMDVEGLKLMLRTQTFGLWINGFCWVVLTTFSFARRRKALLVCKWTKPLVLAMSRSVADMWWYVYILLYTYSMSCARPCDCALLHDPPLDWPWANLGESLQQPQKNTDVYICLFWPAGFPRQTCKNHLHSWWDAMLARNGTCWVCDVLAFSLLQLSFNIHSSNGFSCPIKFFHLKIAIGLALGESWGVACATTEKHWCPVSTFSYFPWEGFPWQTCQNHLRRNKDVNLWIKFRL